MISSHLPLISVAQKNSPWRSARYRHGSNAETALGSATHEESDGGELQELLKGILEIWRDIWHIYVLYIYDMRYDI